MNFDGIAPHYRWIEFACAGDLLQRCRTAFLPQIGKPRNILILGEGNGRFLIECRRQFPHANISCVDSSAKMLDRARGKLEKAGLSVEHIDFIHADALQWSAPAQTFDLIVTHFFLDCFRAEQLKLLVAKLASAATADAQWLLADFRVPDRGAPRFRSRLILWLLYRFFRITTGLHARELTPPDSLLEINGFQLRDRRIVDFGLLHSDWWMRR